MRTRIHSFVSALMFAGVCTLAGSSEASDPSTLSGRAAVYGSLEQNSLEHVTSATALSQEVGLENVAPTRIWKLLEHGEKVECLDCIPIVAKLLYASNPRTREISAWWLRRRIFGVFGPGEVYSQVLGVLANTSETEARRAAAANALGEFLNPAGIAAVAQASQSDAAPVVRVAAVQALERLNNEGPSQELGKALADSDESVRLAALHAAVSVNVFSSADQLVTRFSDSSPLVRRRAAETVGAMRIADAVVGLVALTRSQSESDEEVRAAAVWALGQIGDASAQPAVQAAQADASVLVQNAARIALRRL